MGARRAGRVGAEIAPPLQPPARCRRAAVVMSPTVGAAGARAIAVACRRRGVAVVPPPLAPQSARAIAGARSGRDVAVACRRRDVAVACRRRDVADGWRRRSGRRREWHRPAPVPGWQTGGAANDCYHKLREINSFMISLVPP